MLLDHINFFSITEADIPVVGQVFSFVITKYPLDWRYCFLKVLYVFYCTLVYCIVFCNSRHSYYNVLKSNLFETQHIFKISPANIKFFGYKLWKREDLRTFTLKFKDIQKPIGSFLRKKTMIIFYSKFKCRWETAWKSLLVPVLKSVRL